jgi:hypothetical protein
MHIPPIDRLLLDPVADSAGSSMKHRWNTNPVVQDANRPHSLRVGFYPSCAMASAPATAPPAAAAGLGSMAPAKQSQLYQVGTLSEHHSEGKKILG